MCTHINPFLNQIGRGGEQPDRYIDLFERLREARTYIDRYLSGHISVSPRALFKIGVSKTTP